MTAERLAALLHSCMVGCKYDAEHERYEPDFESCIDHGLDARVLVREGVSFALTSGRLVEAVNRLPDHGVAGAVRRESVLSLIRVTELLDTLDRARLERLAEAAAEVVRLGNQPGFDDDEWGRAISELEATLPAQEAPTNG